MSDCHPRRSWSSTHLPSLTSSSSFTLSVHSHGMNVFADLAFTPLPYNSITSGFNSACCGIQNKLLFKAISPSLFLSLHAVAQRPLLMNSETLSKVEPPLFIEPNAE